MLIPVRDENRRKTFPVITILILAINIAIFIYQIMHRDQMQTMIYRFGLIPRQIVGFHEISGLKPEFQSPIPGVLTLITSMFLHAGLFHLIGNMLYLGIFGDNVEALTGHFRFIWFYLLCGITASLTHVAFSPDSITPMIGASGAVSGILGAYFIRFPRARIHLLFLFIIIVRIPAWIILGVWFIMQVFNGWVNQGSEGEGVAWFAHIGGFLAGILFILLFEKKRKILKLK